jgi:ketosteroid isomerase-like protein
MASIQVEIRGLLDTQTEAMRAKDIDRLMSLYSRDIVYLDVVPPLRFMGTSALRNRFLQWFESFEGPIEMEVSDVHIVVGSEVAVACRFSLAGGTSKNGRQVGSWVRATSCWQRSGREWLIAHEHVSWPVDPTSSHAVMSLVP